MRNMSNDIWDSVKREGKDILNRFQSRNRYERDTLHLYECARCLIETGINDEAAIDLINKYWEIDKNIIYDFYYKAKSDEMKEKNNKQEN